MLPPDVSVVILSHRPDMLPDAVASVMAQTYRSYELIVKYAEAYWPTKLNEAISAARGSHFVVLCDDDRLAPTYLAQTTRAIGDADLCYTDTQLIGDLRIRLHFATPFSADAVRQSCIPYVTALVRRDLWERIGGYDGHQPYFDWDFWLRAAAAGARAVHLAGECLYEQRINGRNGTRSMDHAAALASLMAKHPEMCRTAAPPEA